MKKLILFLICASAFAQSFPGSIYTPLVSKDNIQTALTSQMLIGDNVAIVASTTGWVPNMVAYICDTVTGTGTAAQCTAFEAMLVTSVSGSNILNVTRSYGGSTAAAHATGKVVANAITAVYSNSVNAEVLAIENALGTNLSNVPGASGGPTVPATKGGSGVASPAAHAVMVAEGASPMNPLAPGVAGSVLTSTGPGSDPGYQVPLSTTFNAAPYNFATQSPGGTLAAGSNTITMAPVPLGVNGTDIGHLLYVAGTGTPEACLINGGSGTSGQTSGSITISCANTHTAGWTIQSAMAGIPEAVQDAQSAGGGVVSAGGGSALAGYGNLNITGSNITLQLSGAGLSLAGVSIVMSGAHNAVRGNGNTPITATTTSGDVIQLTGCDSCAITGLFLDRTATPAVSGAGIDIVSNANTNLKVESVTSRHHYRGVWAQVAPVVSSWNSIEIEHSVSTGLQFDGDNDEHLTNIVVESSGGNGIQVGKAGATTYCIGGFRLENAVTFNNGGDGLHIEGSVASPCTYIFISNSHFDTDTGLELYTKYAGAVTITGSQFINGQGGKLDTGTSGVALSNIRFNGSTKDGLYLTGGMFGVTGSSVVISDASLGSGATYAGLHIDSTVSNVQFSGIQVAQPDTTSAYGVQIAGTPSTIHLNGLQILFAGNITTPISVAAGLTDVFLDAVGSYAWQSLTLSNSWTAASTTAARLTENGNVVRIKGTIQAGTLTDGTAVFTLPVGYRPSATVAAPVTILSGGGLPVGTATLQIASTGVAVIYGVGSNSFLRLDSVTFGVD